MRCTNLKAEEHLVVTKRIDSFVFEYFLESHSTHANMFSVQSTKKSSEDGETTKGSEWGACACQHGPHDSCTKTRRKTHFTHQKRKKLFTPSDCLICKHTTQHAHFLFFSSTRHTNKTKTDCMLTTLSIRAKGD